MLVEQFLHIMLNQDDPRFLCFFFDRKNIYILHYAILGEMGNMGKNYANVCKTIVSTL